MKSKRDLKLSLNKKTVARLNGDKMDSVKGGTWESDMSCQDMCGTVSCNTACFLPETRCICPTGQTFCHGC